MKNQKPIVSAIVTIGFAALAFRARLSVSNRGTKRTDLQRHDLSASGREVIQVLVDFAPG